MPRAILTPLVSELRIFASDDAAYGDPYEIFAIVQFDSPASCEIRGLKADKPFTAGQALAVRAELRRCGVERCRFVRIQGGVERTVTGRIK
jgi:hypothetical protein